MFSKLRDKVVVITGASSGIGRATAQAFAEQRAVVVLAARREDALEDVAHRCQQLGGRTLVVPTDVTDEAAVEHLAQQTTDHFGRVDVWVNNAAVTLFARFEEAPSDVFRRVIETNLFGYVHGARAAMRRFREQGSGTLINVASVVSAAPQPYTSAYVATKAAIREMSNCLRMELNLDSAHDIHVCNILPASIDTPLFQQGANYTGRAAKALRPVNPAEVVAEAIVQTAKDKSRERVVGRGGHKILLQRMLMPEVYERVGAKKVDRDHLQDKPADPTPGNLFQPMPQYATVSGGWIEEEEKGSSFVSIALAGVAIAGVAAMLWGTGSNGEPTSERLRRGWTNLTRSLNGRELLSRGDLKKRWKHALDSAKR